MIASVAVAMTLLAGCGSDSVSSGPEADSDESLVVFAAASLTESFGELGHEFEGTHPGTKVTFNFAPTQILVNQVQQGAPADVLATADELGMQRVVDAGEVVGSPRIFAHNLLQIVVAAGNPEGVTSLADFGRPGLVVALGDPAVPVGRYTEQAFAKAGLPVPPASREESVRAVVNKVALGEADVGIVYVTDVRSAGSEVVGIAISEDQNVIARYPVVSLREARNPQTAQAFIDFVLSPSGQMVLERHGFLVPGS
ncbi:MAG: molybdate ABC transporter substrate-binding protein [Egibacteraceae bacterium]